jgi:hypothetical protein
MELDGHAYCSVRSFHNITSNLRDMNIYTQYSVLLTFDTYINMKLYDFHNILKYQLYNSIVL